MLALNVSSECCFVFRLPKTEETICNARQHHCQLETMQLLKTLKEGCKLAAEGKAGLELSRGEHTVEEGTEDLQGKEILGMSKKEMQQKGAISHLR